MRTFRPLVLVLALVLLTGAPPADAEEEGLVTRLIDVTALVSGRPEFQREGEPHGAQWFNDEESPLFGGEFEEPIYPVGQIDDLIELIQSRVDPKSWHSTLGAGLAHIDEHILMVRHFSDVADKVQGYLASLERQVMRSVTVDLQAIRLTTEQVHAVLRPGSNILVNAGKFAEVLGPDAMGPGAAVTAYERNRCAIYVGRQHAFLGDYDVEVAQEASVSDPIVYVNNLGLSADIRPILSPSGTTCLLELNAWLGQLVENRQISTGEDRIVEAPSYRIARLVSKVELPVGAWGLIDGETDSGASRWMFLARVTRTPMEGLGRSARGVAMTTPVEKPTRRFELRTFDIGMLNSVVYPQLAEVPLLTPSNFTPPEPPELEDARAVFAQDALVEMMRNAVAPSSWEQLEDASIEARNGRLYVRNAPDVLKAIGDNLAVLQREFLATIVTTAEVVEVDGALASELESGDGRIVTDAAREQLAAALRSGDARRKGSVRVTSMGGRRNASVNGRRITYLSDYEVEIAQAATIPNPVMANGFSGAVLDVEAARTATGGSVQVGLRYMQTRVEEPIRTLNTPHGELDLPGLEVFRVRTVLRIPVGKTAVVASAGAGDKRQLLLVTPGVASSGR